MGDSGLRRAEATLARRDDLRPAEHPDDRRSSGRGASATRASTPNASMGNAAPQKSSSDPSLSPAQPTPQVWTLTLIGKRRKQRTVPVSRATIDALRAHWRDRGRDFDAAAASGPLIAPTWIPGTRAALERHDARPDDAEETDETNQTGKADKANEMPYTVDALGRVVRMAMQRLSAQMAARAEFSTEEIVQLANTSAHAFRHTFGTRAVAREMPTDVVQTILGHASLQTTSIYVRAERRRMLDAAARYYADDEV
ncbi:tyrosine-type recombinase/integrase [Caballeronia sp. RCC_10]|uniref:tyrosine-type recombinase/integrase n=1 Tax=Caballeronia sp. RCC_10 TaxID=3239227 RepID=UPI003523F78C